MQINTSRDIGTIKAVLGPTNTGKTHLAMERMLAHTSGMIGFPLRLLARENYDRAVAQKGAGQVALITGEEKIMPENARYFITTVESMPTDRTVAFVGIDEIQMCADAERGHIFTERLLKLRGTEETMFLGSDTARGLLEKLIPDIEVISRPRLSTLSYAGEKKITRLPARSAIVTFSAADVYALAELIRQQRGGAAVVMGALSPRTRNAQVDMFQAGEVDYLVATDAVGMGLNMDVDHVALAQTRKFDGRQMRALTPPELAQIAGRAGRHMNNGTFGVTNDTPPLDAAVVEQIEHHTFEPLRAMMWRNSQLDFSSLDALRTSLAKAPDAPGLVRAREADDERALALLAADPAIQARATSQPSVTLLWDVCRIPDFGGIMSDHHARALATIFEHLTSDGAQLPADWLAAQVARLEQPDGDIETLMGRIAAIRTWTYVSHQSGWVMDAAHWQERTRTIEDMLSDALHERLTSRFVDQRTSVLLRHKKEGSAPPAELNDDGDVSVDGHRLGRLVGFRFVADATETGAQARLLGAAAGAGLRSRIQKRLQVFESDNDDAFDFDAHGRILWRGETVGRISAGTDALSPNVRAQNSELLEAAERDRITHRLEKWFKTMLRTRLGPLLAARDAKLSGPARGLVFQLGEGLGLLTRARANETLSLVEQQDRRTLRKLGIRFGRFCVYMPALTKPAAMRTRALLWAVARDVLPFPDPPAPGRVSVGADPALPRGYWQAVGFWRCGALALRIDILERLAEMAWTAMKNGPFDADAAFQNLAGCNADEIKDVMKTLGFVENKDGKFTLPKTKHGPRKPKPTAKRETPKDDAQQAKKGEDAQSDSDATSDKPKSAQHKKPHTQNRKAKPPAAHKAKAAPIDPDSPFAKLAALKSEMTPPAPKKKKKPRKKARKKSPPHDAGNTSASTSTSQPAPTATANATQVPPDKQ